jgi:UDP-N-acetylglucosamine--N-acetylmuramyl-(pentapeptide) pyrophosphoryl-undecaprenol N-acetylglucosamine transferase
MENRLANKKIIISGGGTGGHVFPAIAIADALRQQLDNPEILFVGAKGRMEMDKVPEAGYNIIGLKIEGFKRKLSLANIKVILKLIGSLRAAGKILREFSPDVVVGVGGYASGPVLRRAAGMGIPTLIQEQNSYAGVTNRLLAKKALKICVAYEGMEKYFPADKLVIAGNPVRNEIRKLGRARGAEGNPSGQEVSHSEPAAVSGERSAARAYLGIESDADVILVLGGSLGARTINQAVEKGIDLLLDSGLVVIWQCGKYYYEDLMAATKDLTGDRIMLKDFISRMDLAYLAADAIIARAGALTISELCLVGKPAILVPSPNVAEDHQTKNAESLSGKSAAIYIPDAEAGERMIPEALDLLKDRERMQKLSTNIAGLAISDSAERIANEVIELMQT